MIFNNGQAKCEWLCKKQEEEMILREYGMSEVLIEELRRSDWEDFKAERRFYEHNVLSIDDVNGANDDVRFSTEDVDGVEVFTVEAMLDEIEDARLFRILSHTEEKTLKILLLRLNGYSLREIAQVLRMNEKAVSATINEQKSGLFVKMHKRELSNHSQKSRLLPAIFCKVKNK